MVRLSDAEGNVDIWADEHYQPPGSRLAMAISGIINDPDHNPNVQPDANSPTGWTYTDPTTGQREYTYSDGAPYHAATQWTEEASNQLGMGWSDPTDRGYGGSISALVNQDTGLPTQNPENVPGVTPQGFGGFQGQQIVDRPLPGQAFGLLPGAVQPTDEEWYNYRPPMTDQLGLTQLMATEGDSRRGLPIRRDDPLYQAQQQTMAEDYPAYPGWRNYLKAVEAGLLAPIVADPRTGEFPGATHLPNPWWLPLRDTANQSVSPVGISGALLGGFGLAEPTVGNVVGRGILSNMGSLIGSNASEKYTPEEGIPTPLGNIPKWAVSQGASLVGGGVGFAAPDIATGVAKGLGRAGKAALDAGVALDTHINEPTNLFGDRIPATAASGDFTGMSPEDFLNLGKLPPLKSYKFMNTDELAAEIRKIDDIRRLIEPGSYQDTLLTSRGVALEEMMKTAPPPSGVSAGMSVPDPNNPLHYSDEQPPMWRSETEGTPAQAWDSGQGLPSNMADWEAAKANRLTVKPEDMPQPTSEPIHPNAVSDENALTKTFSTQDLETARRELIDAGLTDDPVFKVVEDTLQKRGVPSSEPSPFAPTKRPSTVKPRVEESWIDPDTLIPGPRGWEQGSIEPPKPPTVTGQPEMRLPEPHPNSTNRLELRSQTPTENVVRGEASGGGKPPKRTSRPEFGDKLPVEDTRTAAKKTLHLVSQVLNIPREVMSLGDPFGTGMRQLRSLIAHPKIWSESAIKSQAKAFVSEEAFNRATDAIKAHPNFDIIFSKEGFGLPFEGSGKFSEITGTGIVGNILEKNAHQLRKAGSLGKVASVVPHLLSGTERSYTLSLNTARFLRANDIIETYRNLGEELTQPLMKQWGDIISHSTGRGTGTVLDAIGEPLAFGFFSPRLWAGKLQIFTDPFMPRLDPRIRIEANKNLAILLGTSAAAMEISHLLGLETGTDVLNGQFGQVGPKGHTVDVTGGIATEIRNISRIVGGKTENWSGEVIDKPRVSLAKRYLAGKLNPIVGAGLSAGTGKQYPYDSTAQDATWNTVIKNITTPLSLADIKKSWNAAYPDNEYGSIEDLKKDLTNILRNPSQAFKALFTTAGAMGGSNPQIDTLSVYDQRDRDFKREIGQDWDKATLSEQMAWNQSHGKIPSTNPDTIKRQEGISREAAITKERQSSIDDLFGKPAARTPGGLEQEPTEPNSPKDAQNWRERYHTNLYGDLRAKDAVNAEHPFTGESSQEAQHLAVDEYYKAISRLSKGDKPDWEAIDRWYNDPNTVVMDKSGATYQMKPLIDDYLGNKPDSSPTPMVSEYRKASKEVADSGFFDLGKDVWHSFATDKNGLSRYPDFDTYLKAKTAEWDDKIPETTPGRDSIIQKVISNDPFYKVYYSLYNSAEIKWMLAHKDAAKIAKIWGYFKPNNPQSILLDSAR